MLIQSEKKFAYRIFGYNILSEIEIPELPEVAQTKDSEEQADIVIRKGDLRLLWDRMAEPDESYFVKENLIVFHIPGFAIYSIKEGKEIVYSPYKGIDEAKIHNYILSSCMAVVLLQREAIPLHGSAIKINGKAYAFIGHSESGKSTLASAFIRKGYKLISDDLIAVSFPNEGHPYVTPSFPSQKLWDDSLKGFGVEPKNFLPLYQSPQRTKYAIPVSQYFSNERLPLAGIFELKKTENESIEIHPIKGLDALRTLFKHTFRNFFIKPMGLAEWHFTQTIKLINQLPLYRLERPVSSFTVNELTSVILTTIKK